MEFNATPDETPTTSEGTQGTSHYKDSNDESSSEGGESDSANRGDPSQGLHYRERVDFFDDRITMESLGQTSTTQGGQRGTRSDNVTSARDAALIGLVLAKMAVDIRSGQLGNLASDLYLGQNAFTYGNLSQAALVKQTDEALADLASNLLVDGTLFLASDMLIGAAAGGVTIASAAVALGISPAILGAAGAAALIYSSILIGNAAQPLKNEIKQGIKGDLQKLRQKTTKDGSIRPDIGFNRPGGTRATKHL
ncbi:hypothetical protein [Dongia rigui]|uniref:Uncharacterized protein n=1 Tax=Dongia rigui TaxID=940149 RepID=A0ABU5DZ99_9PROT|nr:hypothetical protein [Dongia rigui]MDY0872657.1 hypothetical protein [Dongia rigui]